MRFLILALLIGGCASVPQQPRQQQHLLDRMSREQSLPELATYDQLKQVRMQEALNQARMQRIEKRQSVAEEALRRLLDETSRYLDDMEKRIQEAQEVRGQLL